MAIPNLALIPTGYKAGKVYSVLPESGVGDFAFTRASEATRINSAGLLEVEATGVPRLEYPLIDGVVNGCPSLLLENQATNLITYPISFGNSYWTKSGATIEGDPSTAGANLISSSTVNSSYTTFDGASADGFHAIWGSGTQRGGTADEIVFELGKMYKIEFNLSLASGALPFLRARIAIATSPTLFSSNTVSGSNVFYFVCNSAMTGLLEFSSTSASEYTISGLTTKEVQGYSSPSVDFPTSAFKLVEDTSTGSHRISNAAAITQATDYSISFIAKQGERKYIACGIRYNSTNGSYAQFNLDTGLVESTNAIFTAGVFSVSNAKITQLADGYYLCSATFNSDRAGVVMALSMSDIPFVGGNIDTHSYTGDGTSGVYLFMAQLEQGSYATSPTLTSLTAEGTTTTRVAETCTGAGDASTFNDSEGVLMAEISALDNDLTFRTITLSDGTTNNNVGFGYRTSSNVVYTFVQGVINSSTAVTVSDITAINKVAVKYKSGNYAMWINGVEVYTSTTAFTLTGLNEVAFHNGAGSADFYGKTKQIQYFNTVLTSAELETLTSWTSFTAMANAQNYNII